MRQVPSPEDAGEEGRERWRGVAMRQALPSSPVYSKQDYLRGQQPVAGDGGAPARLVHDTAPRDDVQESHGRVLEKLLQGHLCGTLPRQPGHHRWTRNRRLNRRVCFANVSRAITQQWVFGGLEVGTPGRKGFLVAVPRRDAATLLPVIQQYVLPGSTIVSDCWRAYNTLPQLGYQHLTVNHNIQFVNPQNDACTNHIECYWKNAKTRNKRECGTTKSQLDSCLIEYIYVA